MMDIEEACKSLTRQIETWTVDGGIARAQLIRAGYASLLRTFAAGSY